MTEPTYTDAELEAAEADEKLEPTDTSPDVPDTEADEMIGVPDLAPDTETDTAAPSDEVSDDAVTTP